MNHIVDPTRTEHGFKQFTRIPEASAKVVQVRASLLPVVEPERVEPINWTLRFTVPFALMEQYVGPLGEVSGKSWRGNFFKCAEENSQPHWAAWAAVDEFNFHLPRCFGELHLG